MFRHGDTWIGRWSPLTVFVSPKQWRDDLRFQRRHIKYRIIKNRNRLLKR